MSVDLDQCQPSPPSLDEAGFQASAEFLSELCYRTDVDLSLDRNVGNYLSALVKILLPRELCLNYLLGGYPGVMLWVLQREKSHLRHVPTTLVKSFLNHLENYTILNESVLVLLEMIHTNVIQAKLLSPATKDSILAFLNGGDVTIDAVNINELKKLLQ